MKTNIKLLQNNRKYRKTPKGQLTNAFQHIKERSIKYNLELDFDLMYLHKKFLNDKNYLSLFKKWVRSGFHYYEIPSIDRVNPDKGYLKDNIQIIPWYENRKKGWVENKRLTTAINVYDLKMNLIDSLDSIKEAVIKYNVSQGNITAVCQGKRKHTGKLFFKYRGDKFRKNIFENPELINSK